MNRAASSQPGGVGGRGTWGPGSEGNRGSLPVICSLPGRGCGELLAKLGDLRTHEASGRGVVSSARQLGQRGLFGCPLTLLCLWKTAVPPVFATLYLTLRKLGICRRTDICMQGAPHQDSLAPHAEGSQLGHCPRLVEPMGQEHARQCSRSCSTSS